MGKAKAPTLTCAPRSTPTSARTTAPASTPDSGTVRLLTMSALQREHLTVACAQTRVKIRIRPREH
jgi:hypothetical protein